MSRNSMGPKRVLVCGGAGYIGSHMCQWLAQDGHELTVLDDLSTGHLEAVRWGKLIQVSLMDPSGLERVFAHNRFDAVMHFSALSLVGKSVAAPYEYYQNNFTGTLNLLQAMQRHGVGALVFSSTAAVFGHPLTPLIDEGHPMTPINPYGATKLMVERVLADASRAYGLRSVSLRYFNAAGALPEFGIGEAHACETHLIPNVLKAVLDNGAPLRIYGQDYETPDGTCVRDYVHVQDLAQAHALALSFLNQQEGCHAFNLGNGTGFSVKQIIDTASRVTGKTVPFELAPRRQGDPASLVAASGKARKELGWAPQWTRLDDIIESAWRWHRDQRYC